MMSDSRIRVRFRFWRWLIAVIGVIVPRRLRADWKQEWQAELQHREAMLADWERLNWISKLDLLRRSAGAFWDALLLQPIRWEDEMLQDLRYGARMLLKNPGFTAVVVLTLAVGIGANAALFSVVNGVLLNPLPFPEPDKLISLHQSKPNFQTGSISYPNFRDWQKENQTFSTIALSRAFGFSLIGAGETELINGRWVTGDFFDVFGVEPALGRNFAPGEDEIGASPVALISTALWQRKFGATPDVLGKSITLDDKTYTIVGVVPASFNLFREAEVFAPMGQWDHPGLKIREAGLGLHGIGRLKQGVTLAQAQADLARVTQALAIEYPEDNKDNGATLIPLKENLVGDVRLILWMLLGAVGLVLLIGCVNVSNLLLARSMGRTREFAIRAALGAGQWRLLRQLLTESTLLGLLGGGLGLLLAAWGTRIAISALPTALPRAQEIKLDGRVIVFAVAVSLLTGMLAGLAPALKTSRWRLAEALKEGARGAGGGRHRTPGVLVAVEMALALVLLIGAGLMIRSLSALWNVDPGFRAENLLTFGLRFSPSMRNLSPASIRANLRALSDKFNSTPGVQAASFSWGALPLQDEDDLFFWIEGQPKPASDSEMNMALVYRVEPDYLKVMGIPLKKGRFFSDQDDERSPNVAVIDEVLANRCFPNEDPIGKRINLEGYGYQTQIIGVVGHVKQWGLDADDTESLKSQLYESFRQLSDIAMPRAVAGYLTVALRGDRAEAALPALLDSVRGDVQSQNAENVLYKPQTMNEVIAGSLAAKRFSMILLDAFGLVALLLASIGIYGVVSYLVGQRTHEIGIRLALGAQRSEVVRLVLGHGMKMAAGGVMLGLIAAFALTRLMTSMLYGVSTTDPVTFTLIAMLLGAVAFMACFIPAWRASKVDPLFALRQE